MVKSPVLVKETILRSQDFSLQQYISATLIPKAAAAARQISTPHLTYVLSVIYHPWRDGRTSQLEGELSSILNINSKKWIWRAAGKDKDENIVSDKRRAQPAQHRLPCVVLRWLRSSVST
jgi:hypothetical protein